VPDDPLLPDDPLERLIPDDPLLPDDPDDLDVPLVPDDPGLALVPELPLPPLVPDVLLAPDEPEDPDVPEDPEEPKPPDVFPEIQVPVLESHTHLLPFAVYNCPSTGLVGKSRAAIKFRCYFIINTLNRIFWCPQVHF
jgi:hypothetical protein